MSIDTTRIELQFVKSKQGQTFANGAAKVVRPHQAAKKMYVIAACTACGREEKFPARLLGSALQYANENVTGWRCTDPVCVPRTAPTPETDVRKMSADEYRKTVVEPEHLMRQARAKVAQGVPIELQKVYAHLWAAWSLTSPTIEATDHPQYFTRAAFLAMSPQNRAAWEKWASDTALLEGEKRRQAAAKEALRYGYARLTQAHKHINKLDELVSFDEYAGYTDEERGHLAAYSADILGA